MPEKKISLPIIFPEEVDYECTQCGKCCSNPWEIPLKADDIQRIRSVDWSESKPELKGQPLVVARKSSPDLMTLQRRANGKCVFLLDDNRCLVHAERGLEFKPQACQQFPYVFTDTPKGKFVGVSFATPGIASSNSEPLRRYEERLTKLAEKPYHHRSIQDKVTFNPDHEISFDEALALEAGLLDLLEPGFDLEDDLIAGGVYLEQFQHFLSETRGVTDQPAIAFSEGWRRIGYRRIRETASKYKPSPVAQRSFLTNFVMCVEAAYSGGSSLGGMSRAFMAQIGASLKIGSVQLQSLDAALPFAAHASVGFDSSNRRITDPIRLYLRHVIYRKRLIPYCGVKMGYMLLCIYFALIRWFAQATAAVRGSAEVEPQDIAESIETVEMYYVLHTRFDQVFENRLIQSLLNKAANQKLFLGMIVRSGTKDDA
ncbi:MAG: YkgJ family cysteine cluster protein [Planctomycetota bacterium]|nr:YkgJ family cysteine cluster protein [Planctomycetota bacterium]